jgi:hypothetical protein
MGRARLAQQLARAGQQAQLEQQQQQAVLVVVMASCSKHLVA